MTDFSKFTRRAQYTAETATAPPAQALLSSCGLRPDPPADAVILDNACGAGVVTAHLLGGLSSTRLSVVCGDLDQTMVNLVAKRIKENSWPATAEKLDAQVTKDVLCHVTCVLGADNDMVKHLPYSDNHFTHVLMNFGPQLMSDPVRALQETHRVLRSGGHTGFTCWTKPGWVPTIQEAVPSFVPPHFLSNPWCNPDSIKSNLEMIGFSKVNISTLEFRTDEKDIEGYLELMKLLLTKVLVGENADAYDKLMRAKFDHGEMGMDWQALVVSAVKP